MYKTVNSVEEFNEIKESNKASLFYISTPECNVCKILKPKISDLFGNEFPKITLYYVDSAQTPEISAQLTVFAVPTIIIFIDGQEFIRESRNISIAQLANSVKRPYSMFFEDN